MRASVDRNSWHYKLARYGHLDEWGDGTDLCRYFWALVRGVFKAPLMIFAGVVVGLILLVFPVCFLLVWWQTGVAVLLGPEFIGLGLWTASLCIGVGTLAREKREAIPGAALVAAGYRGLKEKTCVLIDIR